MSEQEFELIEELQEPEVPTYKGFWIYEGAIAGSSDVEISPDQWATGFRLVPALLGLEQDECYWDATAEEIKPKGDRPAPDAIWDGETNQWATPIAPSAPKLPQWGQLTDRLRGSAVFQRGYAASERTLKANAAFTLLTNTLTAGQNVNDLRFAFARLREALEGIGAIGDFTAAELADIRSKLTECNFDPGLFDLEVRNS